MEPVLSWPCRELHICAAAGWLTMRRRDCGTTILRLVGSEQLGRLADLTTDSQLQSSPETEIAGHRLKAAWWAHRQSSLCIDGADYTVDGLAADDIVHWLNRTLGRPAARLAWGSGGLHSLSRAAGGTITYRPRAADPEGAVMHLTTDDAEKLARLLLARAAGRYDQSRFAAGDGSDLFFTGGAPIPAQVAHIMDANRRSDVATLTPYLLVDLALEIRSLLG